MRSLIIAAAGIACASLAAPSFAQQAPAPAQPPQVQPNDWSVETVTVTAKSSGPAIWHARKGSADVAIMGVIEPLPEKFAWNTTQLDGALTGARLLLLPPRAEANIFKGAWFLLTNRDLLSPPDGKTVWDYLDPALTSRFATARDMLHQDKDRYDDDAPEIAALRLERDYLRVNKMTIEEPEETISSLARHHDVEVRRVASYDLIPGAEELLKLPPSVTSKCVDAAVSDVEIAEKHATQAAEAWAIGDVAGIKANYAQPRIYDCLVDISPHITALDKRATDDTVKEITAALDAGGRTVAMVGIGVLLRKNGVLERLLAAGITVEAPKE
jgi:hypothetical protein